MVFITTPEAAPWIAFMKTGVLFKHLLAAIGFKHSLSGLDGISLGDVDWEMHMTSAKAEVAEFKPEVFEISKRLGTGVDMGLFSETVEVAFCFKHHSDPVVTCVYRWLFMATANYNIIHTILAPVASL